MIPPDSVIMTNSWAQEQARRKAALEQLAKTDFNLALYLYVAGVFNWTLIDINAGLVGARPNWYFIIHGITKVPADSWEAILQIINHMKADDVKRVSAHKKPRYPQLVTLVSPHILDAFDILSMSRLELYSLIQKSLEG